MPADIPFKASVASEYAFPAITELFGEAFSHLEIASLMRVDDPSGVDVDVFADYGLTITGGNDKTIQKLVFDGVSGTKNGTMDITFTLRGVSGGTEEIKTGFTLKGPWFEPGLESLSVIVGYDTE